MSVRMNVPLTIETPMTTANAVSSARILRPASPFSATPIIGRSPASSVSRISCAVERPRSRTMSPSARNSTRSAIAAACASCVTITVVWPSASTESRSSARISPLVVESRLPVGSSANITLGRETSARATATRCCWPPESSDGRWPRRSERPTCSTSWSSHGGIRLAAGELERQHDVLGGREHREQVEELEDEADVVAAELRELRVVEAADVDAGDGDVTRRRLVEPGEDVHQRRLAGARRAHHGRQAAGGDVDRDAAQRVDGGVAAAVPADDVTRGDDGVGGEGSRVVGLDEGGVHGGGAPVGGEDGRRRRVGEEDARTGGD